MSDCHLTCREIADFLMAYLDGDMEADRRAEFERHLGACPPCVNYLRTYQRVVEMARASHQCDAMRPPPVPEQLVKAILAARGASGGAAGDAGSGNNSPPCKG